MIKYYTFISDPTVKAQIPYDHTKHATIIVNNAVICQCDRRWVDDSLSWKEDDKS